MYGTQDKPVGGRDPLGQHGMKGGYPSDNEYVNENSTTNNAKKIESLPFQK